MSEEVSATLEPSGASEPSSQPAWLASAQRHLRLRSTQRSLLAGSLAWLITVAPAGFGRGSSLWGAGCASLTLLAALVGITVGGDRPRLSRQLGVTGFFGGAALTWLLAPATFQLGPGEELRGALGSLAWGFYALAWRVSEPRRALLAHGIAIGCATALCIAGGIVSIGRGKGVAPGARVPRAALGTLLLWLGLLLAAAWLGLLLPKLS